jgi:putative ABC transport system ATP-binding protein
MNSQSSRGRHLACVNLRHGFGKGPSLVKALNGVSLTLGVGELIILRGPSGSGKSTLLSLMSGLVRPQEGEVLIDGQSVWKRGDSGARRFRADLCGFIFQGNGLFPRMRAVDQVALPMKLLGVDRQTAEQRALVAIEQVGLLDRRFAMPHEMSGGQNQRIAFARMIAKGPRFVFCDEPTSSLDKANGQIIGNLLREMTVRNEAGILCVTHDDRLLPFATKVLLIEDGVITDSISEVGTDTSLLA